MNRTRRRVLLLSVSAGAGHVRAAEALRVAAEAQGLVAQHLQYGQLAQVHRTVQLFVNKLVVKANCGGIRFGVGVVNMVYVCPVNGRKAHGAGFAAGVNKNRQAS